MEKAKQVVAARYLRDELVRIIDDDLGLLVEYAKTAELPEQFEVARLRLDVQALVVKLARY
jgi:hypothetical protein